MTRNVRSNSTFYDRRGFSLAIPPSSPDQDEEHWIRMPLRCDYCDGPFGLRRYPQVRTRADTRQFCCRRCAAEYRIDLILRAYWRRIRHGDLTTEGNGGMADTALALLPTTRRHSF